MGVMMPSGWMELQRNLVEVHAAVRRDAARHRRDRTLARRVGAERADAADAAIESMLTMSRRRDFFIAARP